jgi:hypothetical protein
MTLKTAAVVLSFQKLSPRIVTLQPAGTDYTGFPAGIRERNHCSAPANNVAFHVIME